MNFNRDELEAPEWINPDFLKEVLEFNGELTSVTIHDYKTSPATVVGEHFASIMFRANIRYSTPTSENQQCSVIIKGMPVAEGLKKDFIAQDTLDFFGTEIFMYSKVLNDCQEILKSAGYPETLVAKILYYSSEPRKVLVFEDLRELGYSLLPRVLPNDQDAEMIFSKLAQYHAAVFKMENEGRKDLRLKGTFLYLPNVGDFPIFRHGISFLHETVQTLPDFEEIADKLGKITSDMLLKKCKESIFTPGAYNVLNHGDYSIKNLMYKTDDKDVVTQAVLIDFQICHWGSPAYDLYFMASLIPYKRREKLFKLYFDTFIDVLVKSGYRGTLPTYDLLQQELKSNQHLDLCFLATLTAFMTTDKNEIKEQMEEVMQSEELLRKYYKTPQYISFIKESLPILLKEGVLDKIISAS